MVWKAKENFSREVGFEFVWEVVEVEGFDGVEEDGSDIVWRPIEE